MHTFNTFYAKWFGGTNFHQTVNLFTLMENAGVSMAVSFRFFLQIYVYSEWTTYQPGMLLKLSTLLAKPALFPSNISSTFWVHAAHAIWCFCGLQYLHF